LAARNLTFNGFRSRLRCFLAIPNHPEFREIKEASTAGSLNAGFRPIVFDEKSYIPSLIQEKLIGELSRSDCIIADITSRNPKVFFSIGVAQSMGKGLLLLIRRDATKNLGEDIPIDFSLAPILAYEKTLKGLSKLTTEINIYLRRFRRSPRPVIRMLPGTRNTPQFFVDWDRLNRSEAENACRELLAQMGFQRIDWDKESHEFDLIAELPKKDPDGFEYRERWFVAMGRNTPVEKVLKIIRNNPEYVMHQILRDRRRMELVAQEGAITFLLILFKVETYTEKFSNIQFNMERWPYPLNLRLRIWDRNYLTTLMQQFPQIGYKYFADEARSRTKYRKTTEELYKENLLLSDNLRIANEALSNEQDKRIRAERDAVWKDISFSAAHKMGNPVFAIETNLDPLKKRVLEGRKDESIEVIKNMRASIEKAKSIVDQFKSLTRAQEVKIVTTKLYPILEDTCKTIKNKGVICKIKCSKDIIVQADPDRLAECFDELASNATHWFDKAEKKIEIKVSHPRPESFPEVLGADQKYVLIHFIDNGCGILVENKNKIFDAFFTTQEHGTGLGLALVRRIIEAHKGVIFETGRPGKGADFNIYLPLSNITDEKNAIKEIAQRKTSKKKRIRKE
jgi:signal transduction histidine kinase